MERTRKIEEKAIEKKLIKAVKSRGGLALKFVSPGYDGVPDRLVLLALGKIAFVEVKAPITSFLLYVFLWYRHTFRGIIV